MSLINFFGKYFKITFLLIIIIELLSFIGHQYEMVSMIVFVILVILTLVLSLTKIEYAFWILATELFIGSFGYLFSFEIMEFNVSIRLGLFISLLIGWLFHQLKNKDFVFKKSGYWKSWLIFSFFLILGILVGLQNDNNIKNIFFDFNAYLYFGVIFVSFNVLNSWSRINKLLQILSASVCAIALKTIFLLFYFSHVVNNDLIRMVYRWVRDTRIGEISLIVQNYYRIFFQSHVWALFFLIIVIFILILVGKDKFRSKKEYYKYWGLVGISSIVLLISFSRSIWLSLFVILVLISVYLVIKEKFKWSRLLKLFLIGVVLIIIELGLITAIVNVKIPTFGDGGSVSITSLVRDRVSETDEAAVASRFELIMPLTKRYFESPIIGSGFGTEVSYQSKDPRTIGTYTTYAFEWGYLDILVKIGAFGLIAYLYFIYKIFKKGTVILKSTNNREVYIFVLALLFSLLALLVIHFTTPYLNHPLGIFLIIIVSNIIYFISNNKTKINTT